VAKDLLREKFSEFFVEVQRQAEAVRSGSAGPQAAQDALLRLLREQKSEVERKVGTLPDAFRRAQYAMVCLADDVFTLHVGDRAFHDWWESQPLERNYEEFKTQIGGGQIFKLVDGLIARKKAGNASRDDEHLAPIYYSILSLGFVGRHSKDYRGGDVPKGVEARKKLLYEHFGGFGEGGGRAEVDVISPQPYATVRSGGNQGPLAVPSPGRSLIFLVIVAVLASLAFAISVRSLRKDIVRNLDEIRTRPASDR
jgi:hypothetical protein